MSSSGLESEEMDRIAEQLFRRYSSPSSSGVKRGKGIALVWFRNGLRVLDSEALYKAWVSPEAVLPVYSADPRSFGFTCYFGFPKTGAMRAQFIVECLALTCLFNNGKPEEILPSLAKALGAHTVEKI